MFCNKCGKEILEGMLCVECDDNSLKVETEKAREEIDNRYVKKADNDVREIVEKSILTETPKERKKRLTKERKALKKKLRKEKRARNKKKRLVALGIFAVFVLLCVIFYKSIASGIGTILLNNNHYSYAYTAFSVAENNKMLNETKYQQAISRSKGDLVNSYNGFKMLGDYKDSAEKGEEVRAIILERAYSCIEDKQFKQAEEYLDAIKGTNGVDEACKELKYQNAAWLEDDHQYVAAKKMYKEIKGYKDVNEILAQPLYAVVGHTYIGKQYLGDTLYHGIYHFYDYFGSQLNVGYTNAEAYWQYLMEKNAIYVGENYVEGQARVFKNYLHLVTIEDIKKDADGEATKIKVNGVWHLAVV